MDKLLKDVIFTMEHVTEEPKRVITREKADALEDDLMEFLGVDIDDDEYDDDLPDLDPEAIEEIEGFFNTHQEDVGLTNEEMEEIAKDVQDMQIQEIEDGPEVKMPPKIRSMPVEEHFTFRLKETEVNTYARSIVDLNHELQKKEAELAMIKARFKKEMDRLKSEIAGKFDVIQNGELRKVTCLKIWNFEDKMIRYLYEGSMLKETPMTEEDLQMEMFEG